MSQSRHIFPKTMCILGAIFYAYEFFLRVTPSVTVPELSALYGIDASTVAALSATYYYAYTPMQLIVGTLMDNYGVRFLLTFASFSCVFGTVLFLTGWSLPIAHLGRFAIGFGSAFAFVGVLKIASDWLPSRYFALTSGLATTLGMLGAIGGEVLIAQLKHTVGYHETMVISVFFGIVLTLALWYFLRDKDLRKSKKHQQQEFKKLFTDLLDISGKKQIWINGIIGAALFTPTTIFTGMWAVPYFNEIKNLPEATAAIASASTFLGWAIGSPIMGLWSDWIAKRKVPLYTGSLVCLLLSLILFYTPIHNHYLIMIIMLLLGIFSSAEILVFAIGYDICPKHLSGTAVALTNMIVMLGGFLLPLVGVLLKLNHHHPIATQYQIALSIVPLCFTLAFVFTLFLKETHCQPTSET